MELKRLLKRINGNPSKPIIVKAEELKALAQMTALDYGDQLFTKYLQYIQTKPYTQEGTESYYDPDTKEIIIGYTADDVKQFVIRLAATNKKFAYNLIKTKTTEDYYKKLNFIHEATHAFVDELIQAYGPNEADILECYLQYTAIQHPVDKELLKERKKIMNPSILDLLDAMYANPLHIRDDGYYTVRHHSRLHEILANWAEIVFSWPDMNAEQKQDIFDFINFDARTCLNEVFKLRSLTKEKQNEFKLP